MTQHFSYLAYDSDVRAVICGSCDWAGLVNDTEPIGDLEQRIAPGETVPAGECPECGALAHLA